MDEGEQSGGGGIQLRRRAEGGNGLSLGGEKLGVQMGPVGG